MKVEDLNRDELLAELVALRRKVLELEAGAPSPGKQELGYRDEPVGRTPGQEDALSRQIPLENVETLENYRSVVQSSNEAICITQDGLLKFVNRAGTELTGYSQEELLSMPFGTLVHPEDLEELVRVNKTKLRAEYVPPEHRFRITTKSGDVKWVESWSASIVWSGRPAVLSMIRDVNAQVEEEERLRIVHQELDRRVRERTEELQAINDRLQREIEERRRTKAELQSSEERFRTLIETMNDAFGIQDEDGFIKYANSRQCEMLGYSREELIGRRFADFFDEESRQTLMEQLDKRRQGQRGSYEVTFVRKDGERVTAIISGAPVFDEAGNFKGSFGVGTDITERKRTEDALRESEDRFRITFQTSPDAVNINRLSDGLYIDVNEGFTELTGFTKDEVIGKTSLDIDIWSDPDDRKRLVAGLKKTGHVRNLEAKFRYKDGRVRTGLLSARIIVIKGEPHILAVSRDVDDWKKAENALRNSEATLSTLLQAAPIGIGQVSEDRTLRWTNDRLCEMLGYTREELSGQRARILYESDEEYLRVAREKHPTVLRHGSGSVETRFRRKDGSTFPVLLSSSSVVRGDVSHGMVFTAMDITERNRAEEERGLYAQRLEALVKLGQMTDAPLNELVLFAMEEAVKLTRSSIGYVAFASEDESILTMYAWSQEAMRQCALEYKPLVYRVANTGLWGEAVRQRRPVVTNDYAHPNPLKKGTPEGHVELRRHMNVPIFDQGRIVVVAGVGNKLTDYDENDVRQLTLLMEGMWGIVRRRDSEQRLKRLGAAVESAGETIVVTDSAGSIIYVNPTFEETTGYSRHESYGENPRILKSGKQDEAFYRRMWETLTAGQVWRGKLTNRRKDGTLYEETATISPIKDEKGRIVNYVAVKRDITGEALLQRQLLHAQKMEAIGTLAGGMAHDFNNLLQAIIGYSDLVLMKRAPGDPDHKNLQVIRHAALDGADLVRRILTFSSKAESKARPIDLNEEILKAHGLLLRTIPRMIDIKLVLEEDLQIIDADPAQLEQILLNLAVNAHHAMPDGGQLVIETSNVSLNDEYLRTHLGARRGHYIRLTVSDTGQGMQPDVLDRVFEPFYTTKTNGEGTGLGLSMVHGIVSQYGGFINCYSEPGCGTSFKIYLPVSEREIAFDPAETREMPAFGTESVLLVDDDHRVRAMAKQMLAMGGYKVLIAANGEEALEVYSKSKEEIALIILDLIMPGMGGGRCLEELLRMDPNVKVLVASGYSSNGLGQADKGSGARGFISKPYDLKDILGAVRKVLDKGHL